MVDLDGGIGSQQEEQRPGGGIGSFVKATCYLLNTNPLQHCSLGVLSICVFVFVFFKSDILEHGGKPLLFERLHLYIGSICTFIHLYIYAFRAFVHWETHSGQVIGTGWPA